MLLFSFLLVGLCSSEVLSSCVTVINDFYEGQHRRFEDYDYVVCGAGSAGSVVASRLSENPDVTVLLVEAGGVPQALTKIPWHAPKIMEQPESDWGYYSPVQDNACLGMPGQRNFWARYKGLGGCSSHNYMVYNRGNRKDFDHWVKLGASGWSYQEALPYFIKAENNTDPELRSNGYHGTDGPLGVSSLAYPNKIRELFLEAGQSMNYSIVDYNGATQSGFGAIQVTQGFGERWSTERGYLRPNTYRNNLDILTHARVLKIGFDSDKRARFVVFDNNGEITSVRAKKEIILSAGAINTPQILLLSGIGPKDQLDSLNIPVVVDLPGVGKNLQDHVMVPLVYEMNDAIGLKESQTTDWKADADFSEGKGPLTSPGGLEAMAYINTKYNTDNLDWPDIQLEMCSTAALIKLAGYEDRNVGMLLTVLNRALTTGEIRLNSSDPYDKPVIDFQYYKVEDDINRMVDGMSFFQSVLKEPAFMAYEPKYVPEAIPGCDQFLDNIESTDYLTCAARSMTTTDWHYCCTAKMGNPSATDTVVDPELRVKGVTGLRVVDASVMPLITSSNTNAPTIMIAEKASDLIKKAAMEECSCTSQSPTQTCS